MPVTLNQIRAFQAAAESGSFTTAAERLNLTQSAVSMLIRQMEDALGLPLFVRTGRGVALTEFGAEARPGLTRAMTELAEVADAARGLNDLRRGKLRCALPQILAAAWLPKALRRFRGAHPDVRVEIADTVTDRVAPSVAQNDAEIGIGPERTVGPDIQATPIWQVPIHIALPAESDLATAADFRSRDVARMTWIHYSDEFGGLMQRTILQAPDRDHGRDIRVRSLITALSILRDGHYATAAPAYAVAFAPLFNVAFRELADYPAPRRFLLYQRKDHALSPAAQAFRDFAIANPPEGAQTIA